jgi:hypothetical protein
VVPFGLIFPRATLERVDKRKGRYMSRNKYILKIVEEHLNEEEQKRLVGASVSSHMHQPEPEPTPEPVGVGVSNA